MPRPAAPTFADACERLLRNPEGDHSLYTSLAPVFDRLTDEERVAGDFEAVRAFAPESGDALELGCGVGALLAHLTDRFDRALGVDGHHDLLRFTAHRAPAAEVTVGDPLQPPTETAFDAVVAMAGPAAPPAVDDPAALIETAADRLAPEGTFLLRAVTDAGAVRDAVESVGVLTGSGYRLERSVTDLPADGGVGLRMGYRATDESSGDAATTSETVQVPVHDAESLRAAAEGAGLSDVRLLGGGATTLLVARN
ncbi:MULTISPECIES: class I SAM-dependent methyltransferase [Halolamina]|uniref:Methyltransferase domain-containing protein n=1 Tax=Halolamina pelagica TaxID=699431 RepID=A0A1I5M2E0_9EURY|nr:MULTISPECIES: methyltransferase domain-containing protein [Halolamina]NHX35807.1 class I SAM-dependent methyltransferase [Halolamina sp. R1-12]SFP03201.1 Methyltransferase domain-containing protein [Halolamina pelagica]